MQYRFIVRESGQVDVTARVPHGKKFVEIGASSHVPGDLQQSALNALTATREEVQFQFPPRQFRARKGGTEQ